MILAQITVETGLAAIPSIVAIFGLWIKIERRLTRLETKVDSIEMEVCYPKKHK